MEYKVIEQALENNDLDLDLMIKRLNDLRLGCFENFLDDANTSLDAHPQSTTLPQGDPVQGDEAVKDAVLSGNCAEWAELFVKEMSVASDVEDARIRAMRALEALEKSIYARAKVETSQNFQQENSMLKERLQTLLHQNGILKCAVTIQHARQKEYKGKYQEVQQLKQVLSQCHEHIKPLEGNNYALTMHLKRVQQKNSIPGPFILDIFWING